VSDFYHAKERDIAFDPSHPGHLLPRFRTDHPAPRVLDLGCGGGGPLEAVLTNTPSAFGLGLDIDAKAIAWGETNIKHPGLVLRVIEDSTRLPVVSCWFDMVMARVSLCYMRIDSTLAEVHRVMVPGGELWLALHSYKHIKKILRAAVTKRDYVDAARICMVIANGALYHATGLQIFSETFQTERRLVRALKRAGFVSISRSNDQGFIITARKLG
jgi:SAM-dependent methyltransferase